MTEQTTRESMQYDVVIVGAGVAGLSAAIRLKQLAAEAGGDISVCVVEKGSEVGAHILSGAVFNPKVLNELLPDWRERGAPLKQPVKGERLLFLTRQSALPLPLPPSFHNQGNYIISLGLLCRWLAEQAEGLGVEIYPGFAAAEVLYRADGSVKGIATGDMGIGKDGRPTDAYQPGMELWGRQTVFAEGCRGSLSEQLIAKFQLDRHSQPQTYGLGVKEIWEVRPEQSQPGKVMHTVGWPLDSHTYGGSFLYHLAENKVAVGFVVGLDYQNPYLSPFEEFQRFKTHPAIRPVFEGGRRIAYGARALVEGGLQSLPKLTFPGGLLVGDAAGFLNVPSIKGAHTAMKSAMLAAEAVFGVLQNGAAEEEGAEAAAYAEAFHQSWLHDELYCARNIRPAFKWGFWPAMGLNALDAYVFRGRAPWTISHHGSDRESLKPAVACRPIEYPKPDGQVSFDRASSVYLANTHHEENQPPHLKLASEQAAIEVGYRRFAAPETRYCPAGVYEIVQENGQPHLQIHAADCIHCKTCDIKDPADNITWTCPEGGGGPNYGEM